MVLKVLPPKTEEIDMMPEGNAVISFLETLPHPHPYRLHVEPVRFREKLTLKT